MQYSIYRRDAMSNPPSRSRVQSVVEVPKYDCRNELDERKQNQLHRLNRRCAIGASDGCRIDRRPNIGVSLGARWNQVKTALMHRFNRWIRNRHRCNRHTIVQRRCQARSSQAFSTGRTDGGVESSRASIFFELSSKSIYSYLL